MINTTTLQRLDRKSLEARANRFALIVWGILWISMAVVARVLWDAWYGLTAGLIVACAVAIFLTWLVFARKTAKQKRTVRASWAGTKFRIFDPIENKTDEVDFSRPHRAIFIRCKAENRFLLRLEEIKEKDGCEDTTRINLIGPLPVILPMRITGEARSLMGFFNMARTGISKGIPYLFKTDGDPGSETARSLLHFAETHRDTRNNALHVTRGDDVIHVNDGVFSLQKKEGTLVFDPQLPLRIVTMATPISDPDGRSREIRMALIPPSGEEDALVFSMIAQLDSTEEFADSWSVPESVMHRKFSLYDDSAQSYVVALALKQYLKWIDPNNPVLSILRY